MNKNIDVHVRQPEVGINPRLDAIFIQFEAVERETQKCDGRSHTVLMSIPDAMQLLRTLLHIQKTFSLPEGASDVEMIEVSQKRN